MPTRIAGTTSSANPCGGFLSREAHCATTRITAIFANSEGWKPNGPKRIQVRTEMAGKASTTMSITMEMA